MALSYMAELSQYSPSVPTCLAMRVAVAVAVAVVDSVVVVGAGVVDSVAEAEVGPVHTKPPGLVHVASLAMLASCVASC